MQPRPRDPLLSAARIMLIVSMASTLIIAAACVIAAPIAYAWRAEAISRLTRIGAPAETIWGIITVLGLLAVASVLGFFFFRHLARIVGTVGDGDPFVPANAGRLQAMGWIVVAMQVLAFPMSALTGWIEHVTDHVRTDFHLSLVGLLLAIVLFVLARVFREGTRLREELEGTV